MVDDLDLWRERMRSDWDARAAEDAEHFIYSNDSVDALGFAASGKANYDQLVRPYLPYLLDGRLARECDVVEIGCGIGRMTEWFAREFRQVDAVDVSPIMIGKARQRLAACRNLRFHLIDGTRLNPIASSSAHLVFSYIVFQHIPSRESIDNLINESARVLRRGGVLKVQLNGDQSVDYAGHLRDTWFGETYSVAQVEAVLAQCGLNPIAMEGIGTQYFTVTARKGPEPAIASWILPGESGAEYFLEGFGEPVEHSWRPMAASARIKVPGQGKRVYVGIYFWPDSCHHDIWLAGRRFRVDFPGDHYFECDAGPGSEIELRVEPPPATPPAFRVIGRY